MYLYNSHWLIVCLQLTLDTVLISDMLLKYAVARCRKGTFIEGTRIRNVNSMCGNDMAPKEFVIHYQAYKSSP